jgi:phenylacetate-CoA ligase
LFPAAYKAAKDRENFTQEQWARFQQEQLQKLVSHAYQHVPYYNAAFKKAGLTINAIQQLDLSRLVTLPVLSKDDLRKFGSTTLLSDGREKNGSFFSSSGSTGTPVKILYSHAMHQRWFGIYEARIRNWAGVSSFIPRGMIGGRKIVSGASNTPPFYRYNYFEKQAYFSAYHINPLNARNYLEGLQKHRVEYMTGYAMSNFFLARFIKENHLTAPELKAVLPSSEKLAPEMRHLFKEVYNCKTFDSWGSVEACGMVSECGHGSLHINPDAGIIEILDKGLNPVEDGVAGDVYCTGLLNFDQPLIRYKIGDSMIRSSEPCACGRNMPVIKEIVGRIEDVVIGKDGREMVRFHSLFYGLEKIRKAQVIQESVERIEIKIEAGSPLSAAEENIIRQRVISQLGEIDMAITRVDFIPLNRNGKFQAVISKVKRMPASSDG